MDGRISGLSTAVETAFTASFTQPRMAFWLMLCCLLFVLLLTAWAGPVDGLQGWGECLARLWAPNEGLTPAPQPCSRYCCETQGRAGCTSRGSCGSGSNILATQGVSKGQSTPLPGRASEGAWCTQADEGLLPWIGVAKPALPLCPHHPFPHCRGALPQGLLVYEEHLTKGLCSS